MGAIFIPSRREVAKGQADHRYDDVVEHLDADAVFMHVADHGCRSAIARGMTNAERSA